MGEAGRVVFRAPVDGARLSALLRAALGSRALEGGKHRVGWLRGRPRSVLSHDDRQSCWSTTVQDRFAGRSWIKARWVAFFSRGGRFGSDRCVRPEFDYALI